jgi:hypothetical protein
MGECWEHASNVGQRLPGLFESHPPQNSAHWRRRLPFEPIIRRECIAALRRATQLVRTPSEVKMPEFRPDEIGLEWIDDLTDAQCMEIFWLYVDPPEAFLEQHPPALLGAALRYALRAVARETT